MKRIGITQRVELVQHYAERRDCLDQRWSTFVWELGYILQPLPNILPAQTHELIDSLSLDAIFLSGGNSLASLNPLADDAASERDAFESVLIDKAIERNIPVLGVCRGMQMMNVHLGGALKPIEGHSGIRHTLSQAKQGYHLPETVNSYHSWTIPYQELAKGLMPIAFDSEGNIEAFEHIENKLLGIMWHPERENPFNPLDIKLIKKFLS